MQAVIKWLTFVIIDCLQQADVVLVLDGSSSVGDANFQQLVDTMKSMISELPVSEQGVHVGVMQFSNMPTIEFGLNVYNDRYLCSDSHETYSLTIYNVQAIFKMTGICSQSQKVFSNRLQEFTLGCT